MKLSWKAVALAGVVALAVPTAAWNAATSEGGGGPRNSLTFLVPGSAGGGYDSLAREMQQVLRADSITANPQVVNIPGASGTVGLNALVEMDDRANAVLVVGSAMVGGIAVTSSATDFSDVTPLLAVTTDYPMFVLPESSPHETTEEFLAAWAGDPQGTPIGGGALGNVDHLATLALAEAAGIDPADVNYIAYSGGGEVLGAMLSGTVAAGVSGFGELQDQVETGRATAMGIAAPEPIDGIDVPTFVEQGVDVVVTNWRGFVAPPNISDAERDELVAVLEEGLATEAWDDVLDRQQWQEQIITGEELDQFIAQEVQITDDLLAGANS